MYNVNEWLTIIFISSSTYNAVVTESVRSLLHYSLYIVYEYRAMSGGDLYSAEADNGQ